MPWLGYPGVVDLRPHTDRVCAEQHSLNWLDGVVAATKFLYLPDDIYQ